MTNPFAYARWPTTLERQTFFDRHPEWWTCVLAGVAWLVLLGSWLQPAVHSAHHASSLGQELTHWLAMVAAMMLPAHRRVVWMTAFNSLWWRRHLAIAEFLVGFGLPWLALGLVVTAGRNGQALHSAWAPAAAFLVAAGWSATVWYRLASLACHRVYPLAPAGWRADWCCLQAGWKIGVADVGSCWPLMLACAWAGHAVVAVLGGVAIGVMERRHWRERVRVRVAGTLALAVWYWAWEWVA